ncbi:arginase family protein [Sediminibacterium sp. C3]|uniref:arginase family protein n=1 Tax=Sediminibacterium sp. C3 TaxID=1267211 RepID=UPI0004075054|nr:arginase family protein [Sediminibacterium sp. C3]
MSLSSIVDFLEPINLAEISFDEGFKDTQIGKHILAFEEEIPDISEADLVIVGCGEMRGMGMQYTNTSAPNKVRTQFYKLYYWHSEVSIADLGNIKTGASLADSYAAVKMVVSELIQMGKKVLILGGSHDITTPQYQAYGSLDKIIDAVSVDARINLDMDSLEPADQFLVDMFTGIPNHLKHYTHIAFQSYYMHPHMLETINKLGFDFYRVGRVKEAIEEMEPAIRNSELFSFDIEAIQYAHAPANRVTPNGLNGEEACTLMQYAGMSSICNSIGLYGYDVAKDMHDMTAIQQAHMIWYVIDGIHRGKQEASLENRNEFNEFTMAFAEAPTAFLQSKRTGRWWMQLHDGKFVACSHRDYIVACNNDIPERWLRAVERS